MSTLSYFEKASDVLFSCLKSKTIPFIAKFHVIRVDRRFQVDFSRLSFGFPNIDCIPPSFTLSVGLEYVSPSSTSAAVKFPFIFAHREISLAFPRKSERERVGPLVFSFYSSALLLLPSETSRSSIDRHPFSTRYKNMGE